jgi:hypothetical protein
MWNRLCRKRWWLRLSYLVGRKYIYPLSGISAAVSGRWGNSYIAEGRWNIYGVVLGPGKSKEPEHRPYTAFLMGLGANSSQSGCQLYSYKSGLTVMRKGAHEYSILPTNELRGSPLYCT